MGRQFNAFVEEVFLSCGYAGELNAVVTVCPDDEQVDAIEVTRFSFGVSVDDDSPVVLDESQRAEATEMAMLALEGVEWHFKSEGDTAVVSACDVAPKLKSSKSA